MRYEIAKAVMIIAAASIFFALVHPLAADPIGVGNVKRLADAVAPAPTLLPVLVSQITDHPPVLFAAQVPLMSLDIRELACVLTC